MYSSLSSSVLTEKCSKSTQVDKKKQESAQRKGQGGRVCCEFGWGSSKNLRFQGEGLFGPEHVIQKSQMLDLNSVWRQIMKGPWKIDKERGKVVSKG